MLFDYNLQFATASQSITADAASTDYLALPVATDLGAGEKLSVFISFGTNTTPGALTIKLEGADDTGFSTNLIVINAVTLTPLDDSFVHFPIRSHIPKKYIRLNYDWASGTIVVKEQAIVKEAQIKNYSRKY